MLALLLACSPPGPVFSSGERVVLPVDSAADPDTGTPASSAGVELPMVTLADGSRVDAVEGTVVGDLGAEDQGAAWPDGSTEATVVPLAGVVPSTLVTWYQAAAACLNTGKHLCTWEEWRDACDGVSADGGAVFPWGDEPEPDGRCALANPDGSTAWTDLQPAGSLPDCATPTGVFDQMGNAWEWVDLGRVDDAGRPVPGKVGGAWYAGHANALCGVAPVDTHPPDFRGTIGFRCCDDGA